MRDVTRPDGLPLPSKGPRGYWQDFSSVDWKATFQSQRSQPDWQDRLDQQRRAKAEHELAEIEFRKTRKVLATAKGCAAVTDNRAAGAWVALGNHASIALQGFSAEPYGQLQAFSPFRLQAEMRTAGLLYERSCRCRVRRLIDRVQVRVTENGSTIVTGTETCGSVWDCPACASRIMQERAEQLTYACRWYREQQKGRVYLLTLTVRHEWGSPLEPMFDGLANSYRQLTSGTFKAWKENIEHSVRAIEVTYGANGWHPHLHVLLFTKDELDASFVEQLQARWQSCVVAELGERAKPDLAIGCDVREGSEAARYLQKMGCEVTSIATKKAHGESRTPWELVHDALNGDERARAAWAEYVAATYGKKQLTWSRKLRSECRELQAWDEYLERMQGADDAAKHAPIFVADVDGKTWEELNKDIAWVRRFVTAASERDLEAVRVLLARATFHRSIDGPPLPS